LSLLSDADPCLTPSKPAGTVHLIDGQLIGDITSFYNEIFTTLPDLDKHLQSLVDNPSRLVELPARFKSSQRCHEPLTISLSAKRFVEYSSRQIETNQPNSTQHNDAVGPSQSTKPLANNVLSSSIQAGLFRPSVRDRFARCSSLGHHNTVQTTRTRTIDGKFLTTISTVSNIQVPSENTAEPFVVSHRNPNEKRLFFGQSTANVSSSSGSLQLHSKINSIKRTLSDDSHCNSLTSLTKKVLQMENDRQRVHEH
jgi:hypothetical protein